MNPENEIILEDFLREYGVPSRPVQFTNPQHCEECAEANDLLMAQDPRFLDAKDFEHPSSSWFFDMMGDEGLHYFLPGFIRLALDDPEANLNLLLFYLSPKFISTLTDAEREAIFRVLDFLRACGYPHTDLDRKNLRQALEQTRTQQVEDANPDHVSS